MAKRRTTKYKYKEDNCLFEDFGKKRSLETLTTFVLSALGTSLTPMSFFQKTYYCNNLYFTIAAAFTTSVSTYLLTKAYYNLKFKIKHKIPLQKDHIIIKYLRWLRGKRIIIKKGTDEGGSKRKNDDLFAVAVSSIIYINSLFLSLVVMLSYCLLTSLTPVVNYSLSVLSAVGLLTLFSIDL